MLGYSSPKLLSNKSDNEYKIRKNNKENKKLYIYIYIMYCFCYVLFCTNQMYRSKLPLIQLCIMQ